jgi:hypothetical protein
LWGSNSAGRGISQASQVLVSMGLTSVQMLQVHVSGLICGAGVSFGVARGIGRNAAGGVGFDCVECTGIVVDCHFVSVASAGGIFPFSPASILACCARSVSGESGGDGPIVRTPLGFSWLGGM